MKIMHVLMDLLDYETYYSGEALCDPLDTAKVYDVSTPEKEIVAKLQAMKDDEDFLSDRMWDDEFHFVNPGRKPEEPRVKISDIDTPKVKKMLEKYQVDLAKWEKQNTEANEVNTKATEMINHFPAAVYPEVIEKMWNAFLENGADSWATSRVHYYEIG